MPETDGGFPALHPFLRWVHRHRVVLLFALLMLAVLPMRDLWAPDEPDFAQCVREMRERGSWLLPYLNGQPYSEKPILFYWLMKGCAVLGDRLTGGLGFTHGVAAWALRLPSVLASIAFMAGFHAWARRFLREDVADLGAMVLAVTPIWFWQSQFIQIDLVFAALLAWSWLAWLGGYLLLRGHAAARRPGEAARWFLAAYASLGLAFLAKGPLAFVLSAAVAGGFLAWQRDGRALGEMRLGTGLLLLLALIAPWYIAAGFKGGAHYAYEMIIHQNLERALSAWDHIQPWWQYGPYLAGDFFPWTLILPALALGIWKQGHHRSVGTRFCILAVVLPIALLSLSQSKQSKYILMVYPFLALLMAALFQPVTLELAPKARTRALGGLLALGLWVPALALTAVAFFHAGGARLQGTLPPYLGPLRLAAVVLVLGAVSLTARTWLGEGRYLVREAALTLGLLFLVLGTWGFHRLDPAKGYRRWTEAVQPLIAGRKVYYWQTIRSGVMVYTDHQMPELRSYGELVARLGPEDRLVTMRREWDMDAWGLDPGRRTEFQVLLAVPVGGGEAMLLKRTTP
jgi:4-amino-4-deoxy-L-arabinose transferase-like glycosyltransferase